MTTGPVAALSRRLLSVVCETLLLGAVLLVGALPFLALTLRHGASRFLLAGFAWALVDHDRQFLHDRLAGTRIVINDE